MTRTPDSGGPTESGPGYALVSDYVTFPEKFVIWLVKFAPVPLIWALDTNFIWPRMQDAFLAEPSGGRRQT